MKVRLIIAYDGTRYHGWQRQDNADSVQAQIEKALMEITGQMISVKGLSRTDAGVHAKCNMAVFDTESRIPAAKMSFAMNHKLPPDIRIRMSDEVGDDFDIRHVVRQKTYVYRICNDTFENPMTRLYTHHVHGKLDVDRMREAAALIVGEHDFGAFCSAGAQVSSTVRTIYSVKIDEVKWENSTYDGAGKEVVIIVTGNGFLYNMVRIISGTLIDIGLGRMEPGVMTKALESLERADLGHTAPARGLRLDSIVLEDGSRF